MRINEIKMAVNLPKIADTPYLSLYCNSTKQNDNVTMTFSVNSSLQCFRTAALSMVTLNMESRNPMGRVYAENRSKTQKPLGFKGLMKSSSSLESLEAPSHNKSSSSSTYRRRSSNISPSGKRYRVIRAYPIQTLRYTSSK